MNADQLAVERAVWAVAVKAALTQSLFTFTEHINDYQTLFVVTCPGTASWHAVLKVCSAHGKRNRIEITETVAGYGLKRVTVEMRLVVNSCKPVMLMEKLAALRDKYVADALQSRDREAVAAQWQKRQETELAGLADLKAIDAEIITDGIHTGCYHVKFQPGNALEHLTLEQFKTFYAFAKSLE